MKIKEKYLNLIENFIDFFKLQNLDNFLGVIFYGSCMQGIENDNSDVDLLVIFDESKFIEKKGSLLLEGKRIEYFFRSISSINDRIENDYNSCSDSILSILGYGKILFNKDNSLFELQNKVKEKYKYGIKKLSDMQVKYELHNIFLKINTLKDLYKENNPQFYPIYYSLLEKIRIFNQKRYGYSNISNSKVYKIYTDLRVAKLQHKKLPPIKFRKKYIDCLICTNKSKMILNLEKLFLLVSKNINIDYNNFQIDLEGRKY